MTPPRGPLHRLAERAFLALCPVHRAAFVLSTIVISVSASRVAAEAGEVESWFWTLGGGALLAVADAAGEVERDAAFLAQNSSLDINQARRDIYAERGDWPTTSLVAASLLVVVGLTLRVNG